MIFPGALALRGRSIGLLGGSFNPAHDGHRHISDVARRHLRLDQVWWLVSPQNPLKEPTGMAPLGERLSHARAITEDDRHIRVTALEARLGTQFTIDTVTQLQAAVPGARFVWLMGADNLRQMPQWHRWSDLFCRVPIAVFSRETYDLAALASVPAHRFRAHRLAPQDAPALAGQPPPAWLFLRIRRHPASATAIRAGG